MRRIAILFVPFVLAGCAAALPPQLALVSQAADGVSYVFTGKSSTDHIVSAAFSRDCAVIRMVQGEAICKARREDTELGQAEIQINGGEPGAAFDAPDSGDQTVALAAVAPAAPAAEPAALSQTGRPVSLLPAAGPIRDDFKPASDLKRAKGDAGASKAKTEHASRPARQAAYYVVVGEYRDWDLALDQAGRQTAGVAAIVSRRDEGGKGKRHRVILGPYARAAAGEVREKLPQESSKTAWLAMACPNPNPKHGGKGCMDLAQVWR